MAGNAIVVGGTRRVGRWVSETLLADGWQLEAIYRSNQAAAQEFAAALPADLHARLRLIQLDAGDSAATAANIGAAKLDLLVCAGGMSLEAKLSDTSPAQLEELWQSNVLGVHNAVRAALPALRRSGRGRIITFSMVGAGNRAFRDVPAYSACKAMLESYTRSLARELFPDNITVNCIALGMTELPPDGAPDYPQTAQSAWRRINQADVAALIRYLVSEESSVLTGAIIPLGGGFGL